ncbi:hypothetical protein OK074_7822, partial [Actinobacteria bacterium OK074]
PWSKSATPAPSPAAQDPTPPPPPPTPAHPPPAANPDPTSPVHVSTSYRSRPSVLETGRVHSQVRDTGLRPPLRSLAGPGPDGTAQRGRRGCSKGGRSGNPGGDFSGVKAGAEADVHVDIGTGGDAGMDMKMVMTVDVVGMAMNVPVGTDVDMNVVRATTVTTGIRPPTWTSTPVDRADRGNQPISRRVDTISKQYQVRRNRTASPGTTTATTTAAAATATTTTATAAAGGGAPWES